MVVSAGELGVWEAIGGGLGGQGVRKLVLQEGTGKQAADGDEVEVEFVGTFAARDWSVNDIIECWLEVGLRLVRSTETHARHGDLRA